MYNIVNCKLCMHTSPLRYIHAYIHGVFQLENIVYTCIVHIHMYMYMYIVAVDREHSQRDITYADTCMYIGMHMTRYVNITTPFITTSHFISINLN